MYLIIMACRKLVSQVTTKVSATFSFRNLSSSSLHFSVLSLPETPQQKKGFWWKLAAFVRHAFHHHHYHSRIAFVFFCFLCGLLVVTSCFCCAVPHCLLVFVCPLVTSCFLNTLVCFLCPCCFILLLCIVFVIFVSINCDFILWLCIPFIFVFFCVPFVTSCLLCKYVKKKKKSSLPPACTARGIIMLYK